ERREDFRRKMLDAEDAGRARGVSSGSDVVFEEDFSKVLYDPPTSFRNHAFRWMGKNAHARLKSHGNRPMRMRALGWVDTKVLRTEPFLSAYVGGQHVFSTGPLEQGHFAVDVVVRAELLQTQQWVDLNLVLSSVAFHWAEPPQLTLAVLYEFHWEEV